MSSGKAASQAGHAFVDTILLASQHLREQYLSDGPGTKVVLEAADEMSLRDAYRLARASGIPCSLVVDSGHIMLPHFDGQPIVTALGIGPCRREDVAHITDRFALMR